MIQQATTTIWANRNVGVPKNCSNASAQLAYHPFPKTDEAYLCARWNRKNGSHCVLRSSASMISSVRLEGSIMIASHGPSCTNGPDAMRSWGHWSQGCSGRQRRVHRLFGNTIPGHSEAPIGFRSNGASLAVRHLDPRSRPTGRVQEPERVSPTSRFASRDGVRGCSFKVSRDSRSGRRANHNPNRRGVH